VHSQLRVYQTMLPEPPVTGPQGTLPHLFGVHSYVSVFAGRPYIGLDLRFNNAQSGLNKALPYDNPLGKVYFERIEVDIPAGWALRQDFEDPFFGPARHESGRKIIPLVRPNGDGTMHVIHWQAQFHRRLVLVPEALEGFGIGYLLRIGQAFCQRGQRDTGEELWSWWNRGTARYFPQRSQLPTLEHVGLGGVRGQLAGEFQRAQGHLLNGTSEGIYPFQSAVMGWCHPYGVAYGGMTSGSEIFMFDGVKTAASASVEGYRLFEATHRMHSARQKNALYNLSGVPSSVEDWLVDYGANDYVPFSHYVVPFLPSSGPDPFDARTSTSSCRCYAAPRRK
jgi:hypothetical protein